jgi:hypothetical protein
LGKKYLENPLIMLQRQTSTMDHGKEGPSSFHRFR